MIWAFIAARTPLTLPRTISWETGKESLAAVLAQHRRLAALGYRPLRVVQQAGLERCAPALSPDGTLGLLTTALPLPQAASLGNTALRAANVARMAAACMHEQAGGSCLVQTTGEGFLFRFPGGQPGWKQLDQPPTVETEILVSPDGRSVRQVIYNGPPRQPL